MQWAEEEKYQSYDWWDMWGTRIGQQAKSLYFRSKVFGSPLVAAIMLVDLLYPKFRQYLVERRGFPICYSHFGLGYLNLYEVSGNSDYLERSERLVAPLLQLASKTANGLGWGMDLEWMTWKGLIPSL